MKRVYQRAKANEIAMRTLLPRGTAIEHPSFNVCDTCTSVSLPPIPMVLPPLPQIPPTCGGVHDPIMPDSNTKLRHSIKNLDLHLKCLELSRNKSVLSQSSNLHPLSVNITASKESFSPTSHVKSPSKPVYIPLTMAELEETNTTRVCLILWSCKVELLVQAICRHDLPALFTPCNTYCGKIDNYFYELINPPSR